MGKASRRKKERAKADLIEISQGEIHPIPNSILQASPSLGFTGLPVFRFFSQEKHADDFESGLFRISTLETCRIHENPKQGDSGEGSINYELPYYTGDASDHSTQVIARNLGIEIVGKNTRGITFINAKSRKHISDAFVLCTTMEFSPDVLSEDFGKYCVEIIDVEEFFKIVTKKLSDMFPGVSPSLGKIVYAQRKHVGFQPRPAHIGFIKPPDKYFDQKEFRMLWEVDSKAYPLKPVMVECPELAKFCKRIS